MPEFHDHLANGDALGALRSATTFAALWSIGTAWTTATRAIALLLLPHETMDLVWAEILAASITTVLGIGTAFVVMHPRCAGRRRIVAAPPIPSRSLPLRSLARRK